MSSRRYCLITPCRNEARFASRTIESVAAQTVPPALWVIVDDGSTDETPAILEEYARRFDFVRVVRRDDRGDRKLGGGVIDAFYAGYDSVDPADFEYVCKLDLDLVLPPRYFETLIERMEADPRIGTCSGKPYYRLDDRWISEKCGDETSIGASKFYRRRCFEQIGGFVRELMWDGIDCTRCRMLGWKVVSWDEPDLRFDHLRPMGTSHKNWWTGRARHGFGQYFMGTGPAYMTASALRRMFFRPYFVGGLAMLWSYYRSLALGLPRYGDPEFRRFLRGYQRRCMLVGKKRATREIEAARAGHWDPDREPSKTAPAEAV